MEYLGKGTDPLQVVSVLKLLIGEHEQTCIGPLGNQFLPVKLDGKHPRIKAKAGLNSPNLEKGHMEFKDEDKKMIEHIEEFQNCPRFHCP